MVPNFNLGIGDPMHWVTNANVTIISVLVQAIPLVSNWYQLKTTKDYKGLAWFGANNDTILADAKPMPMPMVTRWHWQCPIVSYRHLDPLVAEWPRLSFDPLRVTNANLTTISVLVQCWYQCPLPALPLVSNWYQLKTKKGLQRISHIWSW